MKKKKSIWQTILIILGLIKSENYITLYNNFNIIYFEAEEFINNSKIELNKCKYCDLKNYNICNTVKCNINKRKDRKNIIFKKILLK